MPELEFDLSPDPIADTSETHFIAGLRAASNRAFVAFKDTASPKSASTRRAVRAKSWRPDKVSQRGVRAAVSTAAITDGLAEVAFLGGRILSYYDALGMAYIEIDPSVAPKLRSHALVDFIEEERSGYAPAIAGRTAAEPAAFLSQTTPWGITAVNAPSAWGMTTGSGAKLLIIDSGHQQNHQDLPAVPTGNCFGSEGGCDDAFPIPHGTYVAGVALARNNTIGTVGVAPGIAASNVYFWGRATI